MSWLMVGMVFRLPPGRLGTRRILAEGLLSSGVHHGITEESVSVAVMPHEAPSSENRQVAKRAKREEPPSRQGRQILIFSRSWRFGGSPLLRALGVLAVRLFALLATWRFAFAFGRDDLGRLPRRWG